MNVIHRIREFFNTWFLLELFKGLARKERGIDALQSRLVLL